MARHVKVATFNANSIRVRLDQILEWIDREDADLVAVQETKVQDGDFPEDRIVEAGLHVVYRGQTSHAGVAIISREAADDVRYGFDDGGEAHEARLIRLRMGPMWVYNTYVPQGRSVDSEHFAYKLEWFDRLKSMFEREHDPSDWVVWLGDFNVAPEPIDIHNPKGLSDHVDFHPDAREALEQVRAWGFVDVFRKHHPGEDGLYTYYDYRARDPIERGVGWRVDHIWATEPLADRSVASWIDLDARRVERPSDHTFLVGEFEVERD